VREISKKTDPVFVPYGSADKSASQMTAGVAVRSSSIKQSSCLT